jgi:hypothetical protein
MTGGLASPPESRINSPLFPQGSSASLTSGNLSPSQCVNPRDLHDSRFFPDYKESDEEDNLTQRDLSSPASSRMSSVQPSSPPAISEYDVGANHIIAAEVPKPLLKGDENNDENATMASVRSRESSSHPQEDDATTMVVDRSRSPSSELQDDDATMVGVPSRKHSPEPQDNEDVVTMVCVESNDRLGSPSAFSEPQDDDATMVGVPSEPQDNEEGVTMVGVESNDRLGPPSDSEEDDEEYQPTNPVESSGPIVGTEEATPKAGTEFNQMLLDFETSVNLQGQFSLRRSSRNIFSKKKPTINYADYPAPRKSSSGRKKLALEDEYEQLASLRIFPSNKLNKFDLG